MKNIRTIILLLILAASACKKDSTETQQPQQPPATTATLSIAEAQSWYNSQPDTGILKKYPIDWKTVKTIKTKTGNRIVIAIPGQPTYQNFKQGHRQLSIQRDNKTKEITASFLEIIPDAIYLQGKRNRNQRPSPADFTGRILEYDLAYHLQKGRIYDRGKQVGESRPATKAEKLAYLNPSKNPNNPNTLTPLGLNFEQHLQSASGGKIAMARFIESCVWMQTTYIDAEGIFTVYAEQLCQYYMYDDGGGGGYNDGGTSYPPSDPNTGGGGGSTQNDPPPPPPSDLPGENQANVDPKKMMECFGAINDPAGTYQVKLLVVEPLPGTSFNVGPNSFGHVAIQLTMASKGQLITQTIGYYPTGTGFDKLISTSTIKDNGDMDYDVGATYYTTAENFKKITQFIASPSPNYHYTQNNCATFAYQAAMAGSLPVPDPTTQIAVGGYCITPAGMGQALRTDLRNDPKKDISTAGGKASASKGECK